MSYIEQIDKTRIPQHVAIIMDGNGRWAKQRGKERTYGHHAGAETVQKITEDAARLGIKYLTLYTFSTENWNRPQKEVSALMNLLLDSIEEEIGMALYEDITYTEKGKMRNDSFLQYKIPTRLDVGNIRVEFESSYEQTGPFGAKSIGEIVINTPSPALAHAVYNATKVNIRTLPITSEKIVMGMINK